MKITILSLFPEMFAPLEHSILKRVDTKVINFRDFSTDKHKRVDDTAFGGGAGMIISAQPIYDCLQSIDPERKAHRIFMTPTGTTLTQSRAVELAKQSKDLIILCGHYEGVDQRVIDLCFDEQISIGDYVLTGGELPAMVLVDCVGRHLDGVLNPESLVSESHSTVGVLEHPQYTRPREWMGKSVPEVLLSGNHSAIEKWKKENSYEKV